MSRASRCDEEQARAISVTLGVKYKLEPKKPTLATGRVYGLFGLEPEQGEREYVKKFKLELEPGDIVAFVGVSGTGKSTCLKQLCEQSGGYDIEKTKYIANETVIDNFGCSFDDAVFYLGACGMSEAQLLLRYPTELSDGQLYRFVLALALSKGKKVVCCDEFLATLDRESAATIAHNIRKLSREFNVIFAVATTHTDIMKDLQPNVMVEFTGSGVDVHRGTIIKKKYRSTVICSLQEALVQTGSGSISGTTEDEPSDS